MNYEVEQKFPVGGFGPVQARLETLRARFDAGHEETDVYFSHPCRDFRETDEAFRIRQHGLSNRVTYKGPKIDTTTKTRRELEFDLPAGEAILTCWIELLEALGFGQVGCVVKRRKGFAVDWQDRTIHGTLDEIAGLGHFVELELVVDEEQVESARQAIRALAEHLELPAGERRSYLELLHDCE